jgi:hypothetical protein
MVGQRYVIQESNGSVATTTATARPAVRATLSA